MSVGIILAEVEIKLECDVEDYEVEEYLEELQDNLPSFRVHIAEVKVTDQTIYDLPTE